jgi:serine/threonine protein phosphatase PrpC
MGELLPKPITKIEVEDNDKNQFIKYGVGNMQGWRIKNEDSHICELVGDYYIFGVFDGHGGPEVAIYVKKHFIEELKKNNNFKKGNIGQSLKETFNTLDKLLSEDLAIEELKKIKENFKKQNDIRIKTVLNDDEFNIYNFLMLDKYYKDIPYTTGCTACVCLIDTKKKIAYFANSGDSRAITIKKNNEIKAITKDHKPDDQKEKERIYNAGGYIVESRVEGILNLSRTIGDLQFKKDTKLSADKQKVTSTPDVFNENIKELKYIVIGCDGIYDCMSNNNLGKFILNEIKKTNKISDTITKIMHKNVATDIYANDGIGGDNMTCIIIEIK